MKISILLFVGYLISSISFAQPKNLPWHHTTMSSLDQIQIALDYQFTHVPKNYGQYKMADPAWLNIAGLNLVPSSKVRAVLSNYCGSMKDPAGRTPIKDQQQVDLNYAGVGRFTALLNPIEVSSTVSTNVETCVLRIAVVIDGQWLIADPNTGSHDFESNLLKTGPL